MLRIAALNDSVSSEKSQPVREATKEAKEAEAFTLYHHGLELLRNGNTDQAEDVFRDLIDHDFLVEAWEILEEKGSEAIHPGLQLLYSIQKNLAAMATKKKDYKSALESYLEAVRIDSSEVTVWYKTGLTALAVEDYLLATRAFEQGLECNPRHWPCLDKIIPLLYALNNYIECLYYIGRALEMEPQYTKAYALRDRIFSVESTMKHDTEEFFADCDPEVHTMCISPEEAKQYVDEALEIRRRNQEICRPPEPECLHFPKFIKQYSWNHVGQVLIDLYDKATKSQKYISIALRVDVPKEITVESSNATNEVGDENEDGESMEVDRANQRNEECKMETEDLTVSVEKINGNLAINVTPETVKVKSEAEEVKSSEKIKDAEKIRKPLEEEMDIHNDCKEEPAEVGTEAKNTDEKMVPENQDSCVTEPKTEYTACPEQRTENSSQSNQSGPFEKPEDVMETEEESQEGDKEVLEALRNTHSLLDSLSPVKQTINRQVYQNTENKPASPNFQESIPSITKSGSYGFNVSDLKNSELDGHKSSSQFSSNGSPCMTYPLIDGITPTDSHSLPVFSANLEEQSLPIVIDSSSSNSQKTSSSTSGTSASSVSSSTPSTSGSYTSSVTGSTSASLKSGPHFPQGAEASPIILDSTDSGSLLSQRNERSGISETTELKKISGNQNVEQSTLVVTPSQTELSTEVLNSSSVTSPLAVATTVTAATVSSSVSFVSTSTSISSQPETNTMEASQVDSASSEVLNPSLANTGSAKQTNTELSNGSDALSSQLPQTFTTTSSGLVVTSTQLRSTSPTSIKTSTADAGKMTMTSPPRDIRSDHVYSRSYADMPRSQRGQVPEKSVVLPSSQSGSTLIEVPIDVDDRNSKKGQKRKRISLATEEIMMYGKRRSARVRNTGRKKEEETVNFFDLLQAFLPASIRNAADDESVSMETDQAESSLEENKLSESESKAAPSNAPEAGEEWCEAELVKAYLDSSQKNSGLIGLMNEYLHQLAMHNRVKWPVGLCAMYLEVYGRLRKHTYIPRVYDNSDPPELFQEVAQVCMLRLELQLDLWLAQRSPGSLITSPKSSSTQTLSSDDIPPFYNDDMWFVSALCDYDDTLEPIFPEHCVRVYWFKARYYFLLGRMEEAVNCYEKTKEQLVYWKEQKQLLKVTLPNCRLDSCVDIETVSCQLELLNKSQSVEETHRLYQIGEYSQVVDILLQTFGSDKQKMLKLLSDPEERQSQILMLLESLWKMGDMEKCLLWSEESFSECYAKYQHSCKSDQRSAWVKTIIEIFEYILRALEKGTSLVKSLPSVKVVRFSQNLIKLIDTNMSLPETVAEMAFDSVLPWILLYYIIKQEEDRSTEQKLGDSGASDQDEALSSSHMLLNIAHDYLGSRCWCTKSDGALLKFFMHVLSTKIDQEGSKNDEEPSRLLDDYKQAFEQCVYCLYGHPNKKGKAKHLLDHNVLNVDLDWEHAVIVFKYFRPKSLPEFDGFKSYTISVELESLLRKIILLIPDECKSMGVKLEEIQSYVEGTANSAPVTMETRQVTLPVFTEIYYLLADYYLKNKETLKAIKFYMQDLCMVPDRLDSWAGMALARMSQLESKLRSAELKMDVPIYKKSVAALRCFKRAVEIDNSNSKLWIEYGTLAYQLHSHASRQIKWKEWFEMDDEFVSIAKESCHEMLLTARKCFRMAGQCERDSTEDDWLHNYMIGKCMEKARKPLADFLPYYFKSLECVHEEHAKYPKKIIFSFTAPYLAVEALEMYYRIHVTILKMLLRKPADAGDHDYKLYAQHLLAAEPLPFVRSIEKGQESRTERESASSADETSCSEFTTPTKPKVSSADHTYFRQKSVSNDASTGPVVGETAENSVNSYLKTGTTIELYAEDQSSKSNEKFTLTSEPTALPLKSSPGDITKSDGINSENQKATGMDAMETDIDQEISGIKKQLFSISSIIGEKEDQKGQGDGDGLKCDPPKVEPTSRADVSVAEPMDIGDVSVSVKEQKEVEEDSEQMEKEVKSVLLHIEELIETEISNYDSSGKNTPVEDGVKQTQTQNISSKAEETGMTLASNGRFDDQINNLLKLPVNEIHKTLIEKCRHALELCMQRFPTHYKSHYRLAYLYCHSPYHKDLEKAHNILLGNPNWKHISYMPCPGLFGERKSNKFFQCIWKIPIDEIERSGSFPAHLNRCIELLLNVLRDEHDSLTLHQVHLQLNRQPEPGKKYLRDAEKRSYALKSHQFTLDAVERQIEDMKLVSNSDQRQQFLLTVYKIWEHGVHKLNKYVDRCKQLLAEAYRVVLRKYETLPQDMLLDQAIRFCKQLQQKAKMDKSESSRSPASTSFTSPISKVPTPTSLAKVSSPAPSGSLPSNQSPKISLQNLMSAQLPAGSLLKADISATAVPAETGDQAKKVESDKQPVDSKGSDVIVLSDVSEVIVLSDSSVNSPMKPMSDTQRDLDSSRVSQLANESPMSQKSSLTPGSNAPTVKIKMGLLQAAKRFRPGGGGSLVGSGDNDTSQDESQMSAMSDSEPLFPLKMVDTEDGGSSSTSSSSDSSSSSSGSSGESTSDDSDDDDEDSSSSSSSKDEDGDESAAVDEGNYQENSGDDDDEEESDGDNDDDDDDDDEDSASTKKEVKKLLPPKLKMKVKPASEDEEESSDNDDEIDLLSSSEDDVDDEKDKDYNASDDEAEDEEDVVMISDDEFPKGRAVIPSPPHKMLNKTEILVKDVPGFDPIISSIMSTALETEMTASVGNGSQSLRGYTEMDHNGK